MNEAPTFIETRDVTEANKILAGGLYRREKVTDDGKYILVRRARPVAAPLASVSSGYHVTTVSP